MYNRILISLIVAFMFFIPLIPVETSGDFDEDMLDLTPHWREFSRDTNHNGIDDLIDVDPSKVGESHQLTESALGRFLVRSLHQGDVRSSLDASPDDSPHGESSEIVTCVEVRDERL